MINDDLAFQNIADTLISEYICVYYVNALTNEYIFYSAYDWYRALHAGHDGKDFYEDVAKVTAQIIHEDDRHIFLDENLKEVLLSQVKHDAVHLTDYRLMIDGKAVYHRTKLIRGVEKDGCFIIGIQNVDKEVRQQFQLQKYEHEHNIYEETKRKTVTYSQVVNGLVSRYETVYYVNSQNGEYSKYLSNSNMTDTQEILPGKDFFVECTKLANSDIHPEDYDRIISIVDKDYMISALENKKQYSADYRRIIDGRTIYTRLKVMRSDDHIHFIVALENINEEVKKEQVQIEALTRANELARRDSLTGIRNTTAYRELEESIQKSIDNQTSHSHFAIVVCDINDLKYINDYRGHSAGDEYIRSASRMICSVFAHSPVFRIGGDEFVAVLAEGDYDNRVSLVDMLRKRSLYNLEHNSGPVIAVGFSVFDILNDHMVSDVFDRADNYMYENKTALKSGSYEKRTEIPESKPDKKIPTDRKRQMDSLFEAISIVSGSDCTIICDMQYDYSRWSKTLVDSFGLPSEYMYEAGKKWEEHIHKEDLEVYCENVQNLFSGISDNHDQQYRAKKLNGEYSVCSGRAVVVRDQNGNPDYMIGTIRDLGVQSERDSLTSLRNQYGFFEDVQSNLIAGTPMCIGMLGIARFSEINEIYGYDFGNLVLQKLGRYLYQMAGNNGRVYRFDGTKFAVLSTTCSTEDLNKKYNDIRAQYREGIDIDDRHIMLEFNAGIIAVNDFNIDAQTIMACLNLAYTESKTHRHGDPVEFHHVLNTGNKKRLEQFHAIRASITKEYRGFYLLYQPVVDVRTEKTIGAEALLRWKNDTYGVVPPDLFIPLLEQDPLFPDLGKWILLTAISSAKKILEMNPEFIINVNLSYTQLEKPGFVDMVTGVLETTGYPPENLCLEITERCRLLDLDLIKNIVVSLRGRGVRIALDDFGTGFSSVSIVKELPFNTIKIDRSFVTTIEKDEKAQALIRAFVDLATTYGASVCIEGIETSGMRDILRGYDVYSFQGYYYAKPLEYEDFVKFIESNQTKSSKNHIYR